MYLVAYVQQTKHEIGSTVSLFGLLEFCDSGIVERSGGYSGFRECAEKVLFCFAKLLANILGRGYVMFWSHS